MIHMHVPKYLWSDAMLSTCYLINKISSLLHGKVSFSCLYPHKSVFSVTPRVFGCTYIFKTCLHGWINCLLGLSNVSLLGILELRKDSATILPTKSILCLLISRSLNPLHTSLHKVQLLHQNLFLFHSLFHYLCLAHVPNVSSPASPTDPTEPLAPKPPREKDFRHVYTHRQKVPISELILTESSLVEGPSPQPSAPPYDLEVHIALRKGKRSFINHHISHFIFDDRHNLSFHQFAMSLSSVSIHRS